MSYPNIETYQALYAKYLRRHIDVLLKLGGDLKDKVVWDFCAGHGDISLACIDARASRVVAVDSSQSMLHYLLNLKGLSERLDICCESVECFLMKRQSEGQWPDVVFCRQGVNYWLDDNSAGLLANIMKPGSSLIFNTFNTKPSERPTVKHYKYNGHDFVEVSWLVGNKVYHTQMREGLKPHSTQFKWIPKEEFFRILDRDYAICVIEDGHTSLYRCTRKACQKG